MLDDPTDTTDRKPRKIGGTPLNKLVKKISIGVSAGILICGILIYNSSFIRYIRTKHHPILTSDEVMHEDYVRASSIYKAVIHKLKQRKKDAMVAQLEAELEELNK